MADPVTVQRLLTRLDTRLPEAKAAEELDELWEKLKANPTTSQQVLRGTSVHSIVQTVEHHAPCRQVVEHACNVLHLGLPRYDP